MHYAMHCGGKFHTVIYLGQQTIGEVANMLTNQEGFLMPTPELLKDLGHCTPPPDVKVWTYPFDATLEKRHLMLVASHRSESPSVPKHLEAQSLPLPWLTGRKVPNMVDMDFAELEKRVLSSIGPDLFSLMNWGKETAVYGLLGTCQLHIFGPRVATSAADRKAQHVGFSCIVEGKRRQLRDLNDPSLTLSQCLLDEVFRKLQLYPEHAAKVQRCKERFEQWQKATAIEKVMDQLKAQLVDLAMGKVKPATKVDTTSLDHLNYLVAGLALSDTLEEAMHRAIKAQEEAAKPTTAQAETSTRLDLAKASDWRYPARPEGFSVVTKSGPKGTPPEEC